MATTRTLTWSDLPPSVDSEASALTMSLIPTSPPTSTSASASTSDSPSANIPPSPMPERTFPTFHPFPFLPREIQFIIWDLAITSVGASEKYEAYQLLIPVWKYFSTQPWHKGLSCCVPKKKVLCGGMMGGRNVRRVEGYAGLNREGHSLTGRGAVSSQAGEEKEGLRCAQAEEQEMVKRNAHPHVHAERCGKTIYLSPGWARSGLGGIANSCLTGRWLVLEYMKNGLEAFESGCLEVEKQHVLAVLEEVVEEMDGRMRGWWNRREERLIAL